MQFDYLIIGGGIFGTYAALYLEQRGYTVALLEKEASLFSKASVVNQARLHGGYHYPRSVATALMSDENKSRFTKEHLPFVNTGFEKYYAIERFASLTDSAQFERFCDYLAIKCERVNKHPLFNYDKIEALYATTEYSFDPYLVAHHYQKKLAQSKVHCYTSTQLLAAQNIDQCWQLDCQQGEKRFDLKSYNIINATYSASNALHQVFGLSSIRLMHEISEMAFVNSPQLRNIGITVMDGQFGSLMPYGKTGLLSLSSVAYTHHKVSYDAMPHFDCQQVNQACKPDFTSNCNACNAKPQSNYRKMIAQIQQYLNDSVQLQYFNSLYTIKSKLQANDIDDGRPTEISCLHQNPGFYTIFAGKINSIYEIEKLVQ